MYIDLSVLRTGQVDVVLGILIGFEQFFYQILQRKQ